jgi:hypothetical protein
MFLTVLESPECSPTEGISAGTQGDSTSEATLAAGFARTGDFATDVRSRLPAPTRIRVPPPTTVSLSVPPVVALARAGHGHDLGVLFACHLFQPGLAGGEGGPRGEDLAEDVLTVGPTAPFRLILAVPLEQRGSHDHRCPGSSCWWRAERCVMRWAPGVLRYGDARTAFSLGCATVATFEELCPYSHEDTQVEAQNRLLSPSARRRNIGVIC